VEVPFLGEVPVGGRTIPQIETLLAGGFREGDYLLNPRVLVRSLDSPLVKVQVTGAVNRSGFVELTRTDPSVYAAIISAGGLKKTSGTQVAVTRRAVGTRPPNDRLDGPAGTVAGESEANASANQPHAPAGRANCLDELSVSPSAPIVRPTAPGQAVGPAGFFAVGDQPSATSVPASVLPACRPNPSRSGSSRDAGPNVPSPVEAVRHQDDATVWYDATLAHDREQLKRLRLEEGDTVSIKVTALPLRIGGVVNQPGAYPLPPGRSLTVWQAIELAAGVRDESIPLNITLVRPASEGRSARRSTLHVAAYEHHPADAPRVESGDVLHVEPTTGSKIKRAVGDFWNKP
jgi:protein involved in polysaccharide export with SLBB domain